MANMLLKNLVKNCPKNLDKVFIKNLSNNSKKVKKNDLFFALKGQNQNGENYIEDAIKRGAAAIVCSLRYENNIKKNIPFIKVENVHQALINACKKFYLKKPKNIIAVTGTNGKSSVADFFLQILLSNNIPAASIGTLGVKRKGKNKSINLTSPDIISLHKELFLLKKSKIDNVILEASSHGLQQGRLDGLKIKSAIFTNFTQDHLDYHKTMSNYFKSKAILFSKILPKGKTIITDSSLKVFNKLKKIAHKRKQKIIDINSQKILSQKSPDNLIGLFQKKNYLMSSLAAKICGLKQKQINKSLLSVKSVDGRLELIREFSNGSRVFLDYAHTPDALETVLKSLQKKYNRKLTLIFGCGGDRDKSKRIIMARVANKYCNKIYITDDNPRFESPKKIRKQIIKGIKISNFYEIGNRKKAITKAIIGSNLNEILLVAGKGHENYQDYGDYILKSSDKKIIKNIKIKQNKNINNKDLYHNSEILNFLAKNKKYTFKGVSINSKEVKKHNLFIAIKGKKFDGTNFIREALKKKASYVVVPKEKKIKGVNIKRVIKVDNTLKFLNKISFLKRESTNAKIIGITGSAGKTSLKNLVGNTLSYYGKTHVSPRSFNNKFGVPLSLSNIEQSHKFGVFEIGMSKKGEIDNLSRVIKPEIGVITNIAEAHIENFKDIKGIAKAKSEIIKNITADGSLVVNRDDRFFNFIKNIAKKRNIKVVSFGMKNNSDFFPIKIKKNYNKKIIHLKIFKKDFYFEIKDINIMNFLATIAILNTLKLKLNKKINFKKMSPTAGRGKEIIINRYKINFRLIDESYNANPLSVRTALANLSSYNKGKNKKYILLGDMLELGKRSKFYHKELSKVINNTDIDKVFVYGKKILSTYKHIVKKKRGNIIKKIEDFDYVFKNLIKKNDLLMIKGSNATGLNLLVKKLIKGEYAI